MKNRMKKARNRLWIAAIFVVMLLAVDGRIANAATIDISAKIVELQTKFPHGKYWNHMGMTTDNSDGYTSSPCKLHGTKDIHVYGTSGCTCNHFAGGGHLSATQCMGFANKLGYDVFGDTTWTTYSNPSATQKANIKVGDIVRLDYNSHSVFVIARTGNQIMIGEANYPNNCHINWGRVIDLSIANVTYYERAANYDSVIGTQEVTVDGMMQLMGTQQDTTEQTTETASTETTSTQATTEAASTYTGWKKAEDGVHYQYYKSGKLQKKKWLTVKKKKYYVNSKGYRVTGFSTISKKTYYFNSKGVLQKKKWFTVDGETYYVNNSGQVLKSQWLWYNGGLVYVTKDGSIAKNELVKIGSSTYYFNAKGKRSKGFKKCDGKYYYCNSKGVIQKKKWITKGSKKYYVQKSGVRAQSKLLKIGKYQYYFDSKGCMVKSKKVTYKGKIYKADKKGRCKFVKLEEVTEETTTEQSTTEQTTTEQASTEIESTEQSSATQDTTEQITVENQVNQ